jgi:hypothetical protein
VLPVEEQLALVAHGGDRYSRPVGGGRHVFGGQLVAQALRAARRSGVDRRPHSVHASFLGAADGRRTLTYEVERTRDGGSFSTRRVLARQTTPWSSPSRSGSTTPRTAPPTRCRPIPVSRRPRTSPSVATPPPGSTAATCPPPPGRPGCRTCAAPGSGPGTDARRPRHPRRGARLPDRPRAHPGGARAPRRPPGDGGAHVGVARPRRLVPPAGPGSTAGCSPSSSRSPPAAVVGSPSARCAPRTACSWPPSPRRRCCASRAPDRNRHRVGAGRPDPPG